jgi:hypothetical protein
MSSNGNRGGRRLRVALASAIAAFGVGAVGVTSASAETITLDHGFLKISGLEEPTEVITPAFPVTLSTDAALPGAFTVQNDPDVNEIQQIVPSGTVNGGTYTITVNTGVGPADTTVPLPFNAPLRNGTNVAGADDIAEALGDLDNLTYFDVRLSGGPLPASPVTLEFVGAPVYGRNIVDIVVDDTNLTGTTPAYNQANDQTGASKSPFDFPQFEGSLQGIPLGVDVTPLADVTGTYTAATGVLTTNPVSFNANVSLGPPLNADCNYSVPLGFSTADNSVFFGNAFDAASNPPVNGSISDDWTGLPPAGGPCALVDGFVNSTGALWLSNGVATPSLVPPPPTPPVTTPPATTPKKCKKGFKKKKVKGKVKCVKKKKKKKKK